VDPGDCQLLRGFELSLEVLDGRLPLAPIGPELGDVGAGDERLAAALDDNRLHRIVGERPSDAIAEPAAHSGAHVR
jgi:hypothetical protein